MRFHVGLIGNGVMVRAGGRSYFSTAHETEEIDYTLAAAERALKGL
jgi:glutamate-1-semialdehyde aminotransferase